MIFFKKVSLVAIMAIIIQLVGCRYIANVMIYGLDVGDTSKQDNAIEANPNDAEAFFQRAIIQRDAGKYEESLADFDIAIQLFLEEPLTHDKAAHAYFQKGKLVCEKFDAKKGVKDLREAAYIYGKLGDKVRLNTVSTAIEYCEKMIEDEFA
jgi:tetratricopeptide (TPR) repeat protein